MGQDAKSQLLRSTIDDIDRKSKQYLHFELLLDFVCLPSLYH